jgi:hypothetical protein
VFCGGPTISRILREKMTSIELYIAATGHGSHTMDFVSESQGGIKKGPRNATQTPGEEDKGSDSGSSAKFWDIVRQETQSTVNTKRIEAVFGEEREDQMIVYGNQREMLDRYRENGNILRYRNRRR